MKYIDVFHNLTRQMFFYYKISFIFYQLPKMKNYLVLRKAIKSKIFDYRLFPPLTPIFRLHNIHLVFSICQHKYKWILCTENPVFKISNVQI